MKPTGQRWAVATLSSNSVLSGRFATCFVLLSFPAVAPGCGGSELSCEETKTCVVPHGGAGGAGGAAGAAGSPSQAGTDDPARTRPRAGAGGAADAPAAGVSTRSHAEAGGAAGASDTSQGGGTTGGTSPVGPEEAGSAGDSAVVGAGGDGGRGAQGSDLQGGSPSTAGSGGDVPGESGSANAGQPGATDAPCTLNDVRCDPETGIPQLCSDDLTWENQPRCQYVCVDGFCVGQCTPGTRRCDTGSGIPQLCDDAGEWRNQGACGKGAACAAGECVCTSAGETDCDGTCIDLKTNGEHCGACGHSCLGGECLNGKCQPVQVAEVTGLVSNIALDSAYVYWMDSESIRRVRKTGGSVQRVVHDGDGVSDGGGLAICDGYIYWSRSTDGGSVYRAYVDGSNRESFAAKQGSVDAMLVVNDMLYWSEDSSATDTTIFSMPIAGAPAPEPFFTIHLSFNSFTMAGGCLYYSVKKALERSCGGSAAKVYEGPEYLDLTPYGSSDGSYLYFGSDYEGIMRLSLADMPSVDLLTQGTSFLDVILDRDTVYYVDGDIPWGDDICTDCWGIYSVPTTGGASTLLVAPPTEWPRYLTVDSEAIYWVNSTDELLMRLAK